jgi:hypothetical protein
MLKIKGGQFFIKINPIERVGEYWQMFLTLKSDSCRSGINKLEGKSIVWLGCIGMCCQFVFKMSFLLIWLG